MMVIRRFKKVTNKQLVEGVRLPKAIAIDEYKGDTNAFKTGTYVKDTIKKRLSN